MSIQTEISSYIVKYPAGSSLLASQQILTDEESLTITLSSICSELIFLNLLLIQLVCFLLVLEA